MLKEAKYIFLTILDKMKSIVFVKTSTTVTLREINQIVLIAIVLEIILKKWLIVLGLNITYIAIFVYLVYIEGEWKHKMRTDYYKPKKDKNSSN